LGALAGGLIAEASPHFGLTGAAAFRPVLLAYAGIGVALIAGFSLLSSAIEATRDESVPAPKAVLGLHESRRTVFRLSLLFALDAFGGGFVIQSIIAYWFHIRFQLDPAMIGTIFLSVCLYRSYLGHFTPRQHFGFEAAAWYWHFVDVVWLFLFVAIYVWGGWGAHYH
jgi:hypothetical protein